MKRRDLAIVLFAAGLCLALLILSRSGLLSAKTAPRGQTAKDITVALQRPGEETARQLVNLWSEKSRRLPGSAYLRIQVNNRVYEPLPMDGDFTVDIAREGGFHNIVTVQDGVVGMAFSTCDNQLCVHQSHVSLDNRDLRALFNQIVCLPNEVLLEVLDAGETMAFYGEKPLAAAARPYAVLGLAAGACLLALFALRFLARLPLVKRRKH